MVCQLRRREQRHREAGDHQAEHHQARRDPAIGQVVRPEPDAEQRTDRQEVDRDPGRLVPVEQGQDRREKEGQGCIRRDHPRLERRGRRRQHRERRHDPSRADQGGPIGLPRPLQGGRRPDRPEDQAQDRPDHRAEPESGLIRERRPEGRRAHARGAGQVDQPGLGEHRRRDRVEDRVTAQADQRRLGLEPAEDARRDREREADVMAVSGQPVVGPSPGEKPGEQGEARVEDQAVDRLERHRQRPVVPEGLTSRLLDRPDQVLGEVEGPEVSQEHRREPAVEISRLPGRAEQAHVEGEAQDRDRQRVPAEQGRRHVGPGQGEREGQGREGQPALEEQERPPPVLLERLDRPGRPDPGDGRQDRRDRVEARGQLQGHHARPEHAREEREGEEAELQVGEVDRARPFIRPDSRLEPAIEPRHRAQEQGGGCQEDRESGLEGHPPRGPGIEESQAEEQGRERPGRGDRERPHDGPRQQEQEHGVGHHHADPEGRRLGEQPQLPEQHHVDRDDDQGRRQHHPAGPLRTPLDQADPEPGEHRREDQRHGPLADRRPEQGAEHQVRPDRRADHDQEDRERRDELLPVLLEEFAGHVRPRDRRDHRPVDDLPRGRDRGADRVLSLDLAPSPVGRDRQLGELGEGLLGEPIGLVEPMQTAEQLDPRDPALRPVGF